MKKINLFLATLFSIASFFSAIAQESKETNATQTPAYEVRKINPPKLDRPSLGKHITCHRPMRQGTPKMEVERINDKIIGHNYGHGGSGWTLGPGAAKYVIGLVDEQIKQSKLSKETPVVVVGAGALGLFSALELLDQGYSNITVVAESFENLTSHNAGGLLAPVSMDNDPQLQKLIDKIGIDAYIFYKGIAEGKNKLIPTGAVIVPTYFENREDSGLEPYVGKVMGAAKDVILDFQNGTTRKMVSYDDGIFMDTGSLMTSLRKALNNRVTFKQQKVQDLASLPEKVIINCTGNGARKLVGDEKMVSVQGHLIMLKDQKPEDLQHMILVYFGKGTTKSGHNVKRSFYIFPKQLPGSSKQDIGVVGGTFIEGADASTPNKEEFEIMLKGAKEFYGLIKK